MWGIYIDPENTKSDGGAFVTGAHIQVAQGTSTQHNYIRGADISGSANNNAGATVAEVTGARIAGNVVGDNNAITELVGGFLIAGSGGNMSNTAITTAIAAKAQLLPSGSGQVSIQDGYGVLIKTPSYNPTGTTDNLYGLYVEDQSTVGFDVAYNIFSEGVNSENRFEGNVTVDGTLTASSIVTDATTVTIGLTVLSEEPGGGLRIDNKQVATVNYVNEITGGETYSGKDLIPQDSTRLIVVYPEAQVDDNYSITTHITNRVESNPSMFMHMTTAYDKDGFTELFSSPIDSANFRLHYILSRNELTSSSSSRSSSSSSSSSRSSSSSSSSSSFSALARFGWDNTYGWRQGDYLKIYDGFTSSLLDTIFPWPNDIQKGDMCFDNEGNIMFQDTIANQVDRYLGVVPSANGSVTNLAADIQGIAWKSDTDDLIVLAIPGQNGQLMNGFSDSIKDTITMSNVIQYGNAYSAAWDPIENNLVFAETVGPGRTWMTVLTGFSEVVSNRFDIDITSGVIAIDGNGDFLIEETGTVYKIPGPISSLSGSYLKASQSTQTIDAANTTLTVGPAPSWVDMTDPIYWEPLTPDAGAWNAGGWWDVGSTGKGPTYRLYLNPKFDVRAWRPTKIRITFTPALSLMQTYGTDADGDSGDRLWKDADTYTSAKELDITWDGPDVIDDMIIDADGIVGGDPAPFVISNFGEGDFDVTKIEFFGYLPSF